MTLLPLLHDVVSLPTPNRTVITSFASLLICGYMRAQAYYSFQFNKVEVPGNHLTGKLTVKSPCSNLVSNFRGSLQFDN